MIQSRLYPPQSDKPLTEILNDSVFYSSYDEEKVSAIVIEKIVASDVDQTSLEPAADADPISDTVEEELDDDVLLSTIRKQSCPQYVHLKVDFNLVLAKHLITLFIK